MVNLGLASTLLIFGASALCWIEDDIQPDKFGRIPQAMWCAVIIRITIGYGYGYGDGYPFTPTGKVIAGLVAISRIRPIVMLTGILASAFSEATLEERRKLLGRLISIRSSDWIKFALRSLGASLERTLQKTRAWKSSGYVR